MWFLGFFFFFVCVSIVVFGFAGPVKFQYSSLYMCKVVLSCWSLSLPREVPLDVSLFGGAEFS